MKSSDHILDELLGILEDHMRWTDELQKQVAAVQGRVEWLEQRESLRVHLERLAEADSLTTEDFPES